MQNKNDGTAPKPSFYPGVDEWTLCFDLKTARLFGPLFYKYTGSIGEKCDSEYF